MNHDDQIFAYGKLCTLFYDATKAYAPELEVSFFASFIEQQPGRVLEAMSGSGRLQIPLMQRGYVVDGVDNSKSMLARCRERCASLGLQAELYESYLENFTTPHLYTTVTIAVGSFQLIIEQEKAVQALRNIRHHMISGGTFLLDIFTPDLAIEDRSIRIARLDNRRTIRLTTRRVFDECACRADAFCLYELLIDGIVADQENEFMQLVWRTDEQWQELLRDTGFEFVAFHEQRFCETRLSRIIEVKAI